MEVFLMCQYKTKKKGTKKLGALIEISATQLVNY